MAGNVRVVLKSVFDDKGIKDAQSEFGKAGKTIGVAFAAVGAAVGVAGAALVSFGSKSLRAASDLEESVNAINVSYGQASRSIVALGEDAASRLGVTQTAFNQAAVRFSAFAERIVGDGGDVTGFIDDITTRAADFASVFNIDVQEALQVFQSGLAGEAEPLKRFGVNLLESETKAFAFANGIAEVGKTLTETQKVQARYGLLMEATAKTQGDFANTSDGLANSQRILAANITDLEAAVGKALLPAFQEINAALLDVIPQLKAGMVPASEALAQVFKDKVMPAIRSFGDWLASPAGTAAITKFAEVIVDSVTALVDMAGKVLANWDAVRNFSVAIATATVVIGALRVAIQLATGAQLLFNAALATNPFVLAGLGIAGLIAGLIALDDALLGAGATQRQTAEASKGFTGRIKELVAEEKRLQILLGKGAIGTHQYREAVSKVRTELNTLQGQMMRTGRAANDISLAKYRGQLGDTRIEAEKLTKAQRELFIAMGGKITAAMTGPGAGAGTGGTSGGGGTSAADRKKEFNDILKDTQKALREAKGAYNKAVATARKAYSDAVVGANDEFNKSITEATKRRDTGLVEAARDNTRRIADIQSSFAARLADIIQGSQDRLRDVYRTAVTTNIGTLFGTDSVGKSVDKLVGSLRDKLLASRQLLQNAAALASAGFSQTFIEQVVSAGTETGNELAASILQATPETQGELKSLFGQLETESESGMDALAKTIYDGTGLATTALKTLYADTVSEQTEALRLQAVAYAEAQLQIATQFDEALTLATQRRNEALAKAQADLQAALKSAFSEYRSTLDEIETDYRRRIADLGRLSAELAGRAATVQGQIDRAQAFVPAITGQIAGTQGATMIGMQTVAASSGAPSFVINVKTDPTKSAVQTGKAVAQVVQKYTAVGGGAAVPWQLL